LSFVNQANNPLAVTLLAVFSILVFLLAIAFYTHVNPWIETSQDRLWEIEAQLTYFQVDVRLHRTIRAKWGRCEGRGTMITIALTVLVIMFWVLRMALTLLHLA
jgi:hypothetical protein